MFDNKSKLVHECERLNRIDRRVEFTSIDHHTFFTKARGNMLITGRIACDRKIVADLVSCSASRAATEAMTRLLWGTYTFRYPLLSTGKPPSVLFTLKTTSHWQIATEDRLRVRDLDLCIHRELLAIKTASSSPIFLIPADKFLADRNKTPFLPLLS